MKGGGWFHTNDLQTTNHKPQTPHITVYNNKMNGNDGNRVPNERGQSQMDSTNDGDDIENERNVAHGGYTPLHETNLMSAMMMMNIKTEMSTPGSNVAANDVFDENDKMVKRSNLIFTMAPPPTNNDTNHGGVNSNYDNEWDFEDDPRHESNMKISKEKESSKEVATEGEFYVNYDNFPHQHQWQNKEYHVLSADDGIVNEDDNDAPAIAAYSTTNGDSDDHFPFDYEAIAEQALQTLAEDYTSTISITESSPLSSMRNTNTECVDGIVTSATAAATGADEVNGSRESDILTHEENKIVHENINRDSLISDNNDINRAKSFNNEVFDAKFDDQQPLQQQQVPQTIEPTIHLNINTKAISKAMNRIRLKASSSLISKLDGGHETIIGGNEDDGDYDKRSNDINNNTIYTTTNKSYPIVNVPKYHPLIPSKSLLAFCRGNTKKSIDVTSRLTRSATLAHGMIRIFESGTIFQSILDDNEDGVFVIHIVGADHVECSTVETLEQAVGPFVQWWQKASKSQGSTKSHPSASSSSTLPSSMGTIFSSFKHLRIELLGPNVPISSTKRRPIRLYPKKERTNINGTAPQNESLVGLHTATTMCRNCLYHDYIQTLQEEGESNNKISMVNKFGDSSVNQEIKEQHKSHVLPHCIIAYNAGVWGYDDWIPTINAINDKLPSKTPFIVTSYTLQEAEDDADVIRDILLERVKNVDKIDAGEDTGPKDTTTYDSLAEKQILWEPSLNPFGSRKLREMATSPGSRPYFENGAYQCWIMGGWGERVS